MQITNSASILAYANKQLPTRARERDSFIGFFIRHLQRLVNNTKQKRELKNLQILKKEKITRCLTGVCTGFLVHSLPKCSLSDEIVRYRTKMAIFRLP